MNRFAPAVLSGLLALMAPVACTSPSQNTPVDGSAEESQQAAALDAAPHNTAKPAAPVEVDARLADGKAHVTVRFAAPASKVQVDVSGVDGLAVKSNATPVAGGRFNAEATTEFDVDYTPGTGQSHLVVSVTGSFQGRRMVKVSTFATGEPTVEQQKAQGTVLTGDEGQRLMVMPAGPESK
ncbi:hypothetical protein LY474_01360 [Myxococcus stipitatus]|uniref:hypothetical protein n=1 Tax=Myxococcus stipitatus TaxID=83455 RepID=UPI001F420D0C|nr:hypothetical protein [Myxococcus stipitatus]MCE9666447.1 hypothetical protein [Myxococcus stipitatus]